MTIEKNKQHVTPQSLLFDLDDTLAHCNKYFISAIKQFTHYMETWFSSYNINKKEIKRKQQEIDTSSIPNLGFTMHLFPTSLVEVYRYYSNKFNRKRNPQEETLLWQLGNSVFETDVEPYPGMHETLNYLQQSGHVLYLYTGGDNNVQQRKISHLKLEQYFSERIFIRKHKNKEALESILAECHLDRTQTWMIGNSLRTDITPAVHAGIHAIHLEQEKEWHYNIVELNVEPQMGLFSTKSLTQVPQIIESNQTHNNN